MTKTRISNLPLELLGEILSKLSFKEMREVRLTSKDWNAVFKSQSLRTREGDPYMIMMVDDNLYLMNIGVKDNMNPIVEPQVRLTYLKERDKICEVVPCDGLLLCMLRDDTRVVVLDPYWGKTRWIHQPRSCFLQSWRYRYALGYVNKKSKSCPSYKMLRLSSTEYETYDFDSDSWSALSTIPLPPRSRMPPFPRGVSLKGNTYWYVRQKKYYDSIICFDFTRDSFGPLMPLPFRVEDEERVTLSCVKEEKLAVSLVDQGTYTIWVSNKIEAEKVLWSMFLKVDDLRLPVSKTRSFFFINEEKKAVGISCNKDFVIIGEGKYFRRLKRRPRYQSSLPYVCSYVPSLVQKL